MRTVTVALIALLASWAGLAARTPPAAGSFEPALTAFVNADSPSEAEKRVAGVVQAGASFDQAWARLKVGRTYVAKRSGRVELRVRLHGGVGREPLAAGGPPGRSLANTIIRTGNSFEAKSRGVQSFTLLTWTARDHDRTTLYGAALRVTVP